MLSTDAESDLMDTLSWKKFPQPVFKKNDQNKVLAPGHNSFFKSPDGKEDWILYHANSSPGEGCENFRSPRAQRFMWRADGTPDFGTPVKANVAIKIPSAKRNKLPQYLNNLPAKIYKRPV